MRSTLSIFALLLLSFLLAGCGVNTSQPAALSGIQFSNTIGTRL